ncbi:hypothetical protein THF1D04_10713 [Vibrio owensii]|uniref:Uncharacterized protein n=1 Tax=Vibrio owensii TaxID=696485 RepID=A0AAU9PZN0_9VIBR|nr:hypothetical protein THF1D04_10713 [Vibrio owensii]
MNVSKTVNEIASNPALLQQPLRDIFSESQLSMPLIEFINSLPSSLPKADTPLNDLPLEFMYRYISEQPRVNKIIVIKERGHPVKLQIAEKTKPHVYIGDELIDCVRKAFKPYQAEARKELAESQASWDHLISSINQKGL